MRNQKKTAQEVANEIYEGRKEYMATFYDDVFRRVKAVHPNNQQKRSRMFDEVIAELKQKGFRVHS